MQLLLFNNNGYIKRFWKNGQKNSDKTGKYAKNDFRPNQFWFNYYY